MSRSSSCGQRMRGSVSSGQFAAVRTRRLGHSLMRLMASSHSSGQSLRLTMRSSWPVMEGLASCGQRHSCSSTSCGHARQSAATALSHSSAQSERFTSRMKSPRMTGACTHWFAVSLNLARRGLASHSAPMASSFSKAHPPRSTSVSVYPKIGAAVNAPIDSLRRASPPFATSSDALRSAVASANVSKRRWSPSSLKPSSSKERRGAARANLRTAASALHSSEPHLLNWHTAST
mmetsp:Transcript_1486/g.3723  ORF Transcript_1486/g.3723 Transcript_1486/m.3723 type:complete len:234 (+) Transcript_1486:758-1459(+)